MKIDTHFAAILPTTGLPTIAPATSGDFAATLKQATSASRSASPQYTVTPAVAEAQRQSKRAETERVAHAAVAKELHDYMAKTPAEHLREAVLKELGLTEESLKAMPPAERQAAEAKINQRIKERLAGKEDGPQDPAVTPIQGSQTAAVGDGSGPVADPAALQMLIARMQAS